MRMNQDERRFDFHGLGAALKRAREEKGWTQAYVAELVDRDSRTIMNIENKGQYPSFDLFVKLITMFDVSVDQFIHADGGARSSSCRKHIDVLLNSMTEKCSCLKESDFIICRDRKSTRLNSSHIEESRMPSSA